jgi:hypothetical protein
MTNEMMANSKSRWIRPLATWNITKLPAHMIASRMAIIRNGPNLIGLLLCSSKSLAERYFEAATPGKTWRRQLDSTQLHCPEGAAVCESSENSFVPPV